MSIDKTSEAMEQFADGLIGLFLGTMKSLDSRLNKIFDQRTREQDTESQSAVSKESNSSDSEIRGPYTNDKSGTNSNT